jgi:hypothetical protein
MFIYKIDIFTYRIHYSTIGVGWIVVCMVYAYAGFVNRTLSHYVKLQFRALGATNYVLLIESTGSVEDLC